MSLRKRQFSVVVKSALALTIIVAMVNLVQTLRLLLTPDVADTPVAAVESQLDEWRPVLFSGDADVATTAHLNQMPDAFAAGCPKESIGQLALYGDTFPALPPTADLPEFAGPEMLWYRIGICVMQRFATDGTLNGILIRTSLKRQQVLDRLTSEGIVWKSAEKDAITVRLSDTEFWIMMFPEESDHQSVITLVALET